MTSIQTETIETQRHISVTGGLGSEEEQRRFLKALREQNGVTEIHITFFETKTLPALILEALKLQRKLAPQIPLNIFVLHRHLSHYLNRLGIQNKLVFEKSLTHSTERTFQAIAIGGSAESLDKIFTIVKNLTLTGISIFIVQHFPRDARNILDTLLQDKTQYKPIIPENNTKVEPYTIYIAPPDFHMVVEQGHIRLRQDPPVNYSRPSIDVLFESLSREYRNGLLAILLCGYGSDGSHSLQRVRTNGSRVIIEDPLDCSARDMPQNAINTGLYDYKFPIQELAHYLARTIRKTDITLGERQITEFLAELHKQYGYDYRNYSIESIKRRLQQAMEKQGISSFSDFSAQALNDPDRFEELFLEFSINVTNFFRNPEVFKVIRDEVLPYLDTYPHVKIWCAGCSTGEEPYSLAILLYESGLLKKAQIYATDINPFVIAEAKNGLFATGSLPTDQQNYRDSGGTGNLRDYFEPVEDILRVKASLREKILFFQHSLVNSGILNEFHLILCRNVLIYFNQSLQMNTYKLFQESLDRNGFLILGESETIPLHHPTLAFDAFDLAHKIYRRRKFL